MKLATVPVAIPIPVDPLEEAFQLHGQGHRVAAVMLAETVVRSAAADLWAAKMPGRKRCYSGKVLKELLCSNRIIDKSLSAELQRHSIRSMRCAFDNISEGDALQLIEQSESLRTRLRSLVDAPLRVGA